MTLRSLIPDIRVPAPFTGGNEEFQGALVVEHGRVVGLQPTEVTAPRLVIPALVEAHCHLDKCHTIARLPDVGGDLAHAIAAQARDKANWDAEDLRTRASRGLAELAKAGCRLVRSHVDWGDDPEPPLAWSVLSELAQDTGSPIALTLSPLAGPDLWQTPEAGTKLARLAASQGAALGSFLFDQPDRRAGVRAVFALADRFGLGLDFHVDEGLTDGLDGLEMIADVAIETGFQGPVLCGHACSLMNYDKPALDRLIEKLLRAGLFVAALPTTNLYLQGRTDGTPDRRGLTRLRELHAAGVPIVLGSDNVADAFCPVGQHDPMAALHLAVLAAHLDPPLDRWLETVTTHAARALGQSPVLVPGAALQDLRLSRTETLAGLVAGTSPLTPLTSGDAT